MARLAFLTLPAEAGESHATEARSVLAKGPAHAVDRTGRRFLPSGIFMGAVYLPGAPGG